MRYTVIVYGPLAATDGQLGSGIWSTIAAIGGQVAGPIAGTIPGVSQRIANVIGAGAQAAVQLFTPRPSAGGPARGLAAIRSFTQQVLSQFDQIAAQLQGGNLTPQQATAAADALVRALDDRQLVYQAEHGDDADVLNAAKSTARQRAADIRTAADQIAAASPPAATVPGQTFPGTTPSTPGAATGTGSTPGTTSPETAMIAGIPVTHLLVLGGIGLAVYLIAFR